MSIPGSASPLFFQTAAGGAAAVSGPIKSLRFNDPDSAYLDKTFSSAGDRKKWTFSAWVKRAEDSGTNFLLVAGSSDAHAIYMNGVGSSATLVVSRYISGFDYYIETTAVFRDPSAWYHVVVAYDTSASTASQRVMIWINGQLQTQFGTANYPAQNVEYEIGNNVNHRIGRYMDGYMADVHFVNGYHRVASDFGETDSNGLWVHKEYDQAYGSNGFHLLDFANESTIGHDSSGNDNDFTANNFSTEPTYRAVAGTHSGKAGISFNGTNAEITLSSDTDLNPGSGVFTLECYAYALSGGASAFGIYDGSPGGNGSFVLRRVGAGTLMVERHNAAFDITGAAFSENTWHHVAVTRDSSNNVRLFVDGTQSGSTSTNNTHNYQGTFRLGRDNNQFTNGYISNLRLIKGTCLYTSNFTAPTGNLTNVTNTKLLMAQSTTSPVAATVKPSNVTISGSGDASVIDVLFDVPINGTQSDTGAGGEVSGNYATFNPLDSASGVTLSNGNLQFVASNSSDTSKGTIGVSSGKWYWEVTATLLNNGQVGIADSSHSLTTYVGGTATSYAFHVGNGTKINNTSHTSYSSGCSAGDIIGVALDLDSSTTTLTFYKNGTSLGTAFSGISGTFFPAVSRTSTAISSDALTYNINFGQRAFAYSAPSGFKALCTTNLPAPTIANPQEHFQVKLWQGDGNTSESIRGFLFVPDIMWHKVRSNASTDHYLFDSVRDASSQFKKYLKPNSRDNASAVDGALEYFWNVTNNSGYQMANGASGAAGVKAFDTNGYNYVGWTWDAGTTTSSNTNGSITSQVRASTTNGTSIVTYDGTGANGTVGHGLGAPPEMIIFKDINRNDEPWFVYHSALGNQANLFLNTNAAATTGQSDFMNSTSPTNTVFSVGNATGKQNRSGSNFIAYCFAPIPQYSAIGEYTGNGNTSGDGPFVYTGFRPAFIMIKANNGSEDAHWAIFDYRRLQRNGDGQNPILYPNRDTDEFTGNEYRIDILSNGFKIKVTLAGGINFNNTTHVYYAVAERPFQTNGGLAR